MRLVLLILGIGTVVGVLLFSLKEADEPTTDSRVPSPSVGTPAGNAPRLSPRSEGQDPSSGSDASGEPSRARVTSHCVLTGHVRVGSVPVPSAVVRALRPDGDHVVLDDAVELGRARTDGRGQFELELEARDCVLVAGAEDLRSVDGLFVRPAPGQSLEEIDLQVLVLHDVDGTVTNGDDQPVAGATVRAYVSARANHHGRAEIEGTSWLPVVPDSAISAEQGEFSLALPTEDWQLFVESRGYGRGQVQVRAPPSGPVRITLPGPGPDRSFRVFGTVVGPDGNPVAGAMIRKMGTAGEASTDEEGRFDLEIPPESRALFQGLLVRADGYVDRFESRHSRAGDTGPLLIRLDRGFVISGRLLDPQGGRIDQQKIEFYSADGNCAQREAVRRELLRFGRDSTYTDAEGAFSLDGLAAGKYRLQHFTRWDGRAQLVSVVLADAGTTSVSFVVGRVDAPEVILTGHVRDAKTGRPLEKASVSVAEVSETRGLPAFNLGTRSARTGVDGAFLLQGLQPGSYKVRCWRTGYADAEPMTIHHEEGQHVLDLVLSAELPAGSGHDLDVTVLDCLGRPATDAVVKARGEDGHWIRFPCDRDRSPWMPVGQKTPVVLTGESGKALLRDLPEGPVTLVVAQSAWQNEVVQVVRPGEQGPGHVVIHLDTVPGGRDLRPVSVLIVTEKGDWPALSEGFELRVLDTNGNLVTSTIAERSEGVFVIRRPGQEEIRTDRSMVEMFVPADFPSRMRVRAQGYSDFETDVPKGRGRQVLVLLREQR